MIANNDLGKDDLTGGFQYDAYGRIVRIGDGGADSGASDFARRCLHQSVPWDERAENGSGIDRRLRGVNA